MTRARALKQIIRDRAARTGERYTTARRHVLAQATHKKGLPPPIASASPTSRTSAALPPSTPASTKGGLSDKTSIARTGHDLAHWFAVLDRFGAVEKGHTASARHLADTHKVDGWYAQGITVAYERLRGVRAVNQRVDGSYEVSASKTIAAKTADIIKMISSKRQRQGWLIDVEPSLARALVAAVDSKASKGFTVRADGLATFRYKWDTTTVQFYIAPTKTGKMLVVVTNAKLASTAMLEERRALWRAALAALAAQLAA